MDDGEAPRFGRRIFVWTGVAGAAGAAIGCGSSPTVADGGDGGSTDRDAGQVIEEDASRPTDAGSVEPPEAVTESASFPLGIACGDATPTSALFWARYDGSRPLELGVWEMDGETYARTAHAGPVSAVDGFVRADVAGLTAGARHRYCFFEMEGATRAARSPIGRMRAAIAAGAMEPLTLGAVACTTNARTPEPLARAAQNDLDLFVFLGDTTYNDGARTLGEYRDKWEENLTKSQYRSLRASTSVLATWDDHEFDNDWSPETFPPAQRDAAVQAFFDHQPVRRDAAAPARVYKRLTWGRTLDLFVLDCRSERRPSANELVSRAQLDWLKAGLGASTAVFKIIVSSLPVCQAPSGFSRPAIERWEGNTAQRNEILRFIDDEPVTGVLWLAGDFHLATAGRVSRSGAGSTQIEMLAGPGAQAGSSQANLFQPPQFDFSTTTNNYASLRLDPAAGTITVRWIDGSGGVIEMQEYRPS